MPKTKTWILLSAPFVVLSRLSRTEIPFFGMGQIDRGMLQYSHSSELFAVLFVYIDKEQSDKLEFDKGV